MFFKEMKSPYFSFAFFGHMSGVDLATVASASDPIPFRWSRQWRVTTVSENKDPSVGMSLTQDEVWVSNFSSQAVRAGPEAR